MDSVARRVLSAIEKTPEGIAKLDVLKSLRLCGDSTLRTTLSRLGKAGKIIRLKRGTYAANPIRDVFAAAQETFNGYIGFSSALYVHRLIAEMPFAITIVTKNESESKVVGAYEVKAVAMGARAVGFVNVGGLTVSSRAKTLFDCIYLKRYSIGQEKLIDAYRGARMSPEEWEEFGSYVKRFATAKSLGSLKEAEMMIRRR